MAVSSPYMSLKGKREKKYIGYVHVKIVCNSRYCLHCTGYVGAAIYTPMAL